MLGIEGGKKTDNKEPVASLFFSEISLDGFETLHANTFYTHRSDPRSQ